MQAQVGHNPSQEVNAGLSTLLVRQFMDSWPMSKQFTYNHLMACRFKCFIDGSMCKSAQWDSNVGASHMDLKSALRLILSTFRLYLHGLTNGPWNQKCQSCLWGCKPHRDTLFRNNVLQVNGGGSWSHQEFVWHQKPPLCFNLVK